MSGRLDGKVELITGTGGGLGRAAALRFTAEGADLGDKGLKARTRDCAPLKIDRSVCSPQTVRLWCRRRARHWRANRGQDVPDESVLLIDDPRPNVRRLTLNRPAKRNALNDDLRGSLFEALRSADKDKEISVVVIRGSGPSFCAGYDLSGVNNDVERAIAHADGWWPRHVVNNWFEMWDMATPIIGQVHGHCLAGGSELAAACDLLYVAHDAQIGYPPVRLMSPPDMQWQTWYMGLRRGMEALLTGDAMSGDEAVAAGFANRAVKAEDLGDLVLSVAERVAKVPADLLALNKRSAHRAMESAGIRSGIRATAEIQAMGFHQASSREYMKSFAAKGVKDALSERDRAFGDYREAKS
jgi:enoyl-CoA hydratase